MYHPPGQWRPIEAAPNDKYLLLGWRIPPDNPDGFLHLIATGTLQDGQWNEGPGPRPDFWMDELPTRGRRLMVDAPSGVAVIVGWDYQDGDQLYYDFDVTELEEGRWIEGPVQPDWWMFGPDLPIK